MMGLVHTLRCRATMRIATTLRPTAHVRPPMPVQVSLRALWSAPHMNRVGKAMAFGGLAASIVEVARCDDDDDDADNEPLTPAQQAHADRIETLKKGAKAVAITPGMALFLIGGLAVPLGGMIAQGATISTTVAGMACSIGVLGGLVAASTKTKHKEVEALKSDANNGKFPTILFLHYGGGILFAAGSTFIRAGHPMSVGVTTAASVVTTAVIYALLLKPTEQSIAMKEA